MNSLEAIVLLVGSSQFCSREKLALKKSSFKLAVDTSSLFQMWSKVLSLHPSFIFFELGHSYDSEYHRELRKILEQLRERFSNKIYLSLVITDSRNLFYAGDLLFKQESLQGSDLINSFIVLPPSSLPSAPSVAEQIIHTISLLQENFESSGGTLGSVPALNSESWVQSMADPASKELWYRWLPRYARYTTESPVIVGETGTGKTKLAFAVHQLSGREGKFLSITPRDFSSPELVQAELFGSTAGAFTGAVDKWGIIKEVEKGTLFIDELQSIDKDLQGKLITFIENKIYRRVGSSQTTTADVRFIFATNRKLYDLVEEGVLREDFSYRLERIELRLLPLRKRKLDITAAASFALAKIMRQRPLKRLIKGLTPSAHRVLLNYNWPGNLRQLENYLAKLCELADIEKEELINQKTAREVIPYYSEIEAENSSEIFAQISQELSQEALKGKFSSLEQIEDEFVKRARAFAYNLAEGDFKKASFLLKDNESLLKLFFFDSIESEQFKFKNN
ncbi:MAG: AAA family ATPase [Candidatus Dadabacteria bacterium]|nr:MAG: AAA family ATPase [Candidatus Dadabacteria bacterium]